jgi:hypothetical protein
VNPVGQPASRSPDEGNSKQRRDEGPTWLTEDEKIEVVVERLSAIDLYGGVLTRRDALKLWGSTAHYITTWEQPDPVFDLTDRVASILQEVGDYYEQDPWVLTHPSVDSPAAILTRACEGAVVGVLPELRFDIVDGQVEPWTDLVMEAWRQRRRAQEAW